MSKTRCFAVMGAVIALFSPVAPLQAQTDSPFSRQSFETWLNANPERIFQFAAFEGFLEAQGVKDVVPTWQLLRTSSSAPGCGLSAFEIAPSSLWPNLVNTLRFAKDEVIPLIGPLEAVSGYRPPALNQCSGGAARSAHAEYWALDFVPQPGVTREQMIATVCRAHEDRGRSYNIGLGFYTRVRFHLDSRSFRRWGPDGTRFTSPCWAALNLPVPDKPEAPVPPPIDGSAPIIVPPIPPVSPGAVSVPMNGPTSAKRTPTPVAVPGMPLPKRPSQ